MAVLSNDCPHCLTVKVAFRIMWSASAPNQQSIWNCIAICAACGKPVCFQVIGTGRGGNPTQYEGEISTAYGIIAIWPPTTALAAPPHTPATVARRFLEGEEAFGRRSWNAAVAMYRSALDIATKGLESVPENQTFFKRLQWLHDEHRITPDMKDWADHVRVEGNDALHDPDEFTEEDAKPLRLFTEMFLRYTFELPGEVRAFRGEAPRAT